MGDEDRTEIVEAVKDRIDEMQHAIADAINATIRDVPVIGTMPDQLREIVLGSIVVADLARATAEHESLKAELEDAKAELARAQSQHARERIGMRSVK
jgi:hypothetical protein